jgi:hypothetical protein
MDTQTKKELINDYLNYSEEFTDLLVELIRIKEGHYTKKDILQFVGYSEDEVRKTDSAFPIDYFRNIQYLYPDINNAYLIMDYTRGFCGELKNVNNLVAEKILKSF